MDSVQRLLKDRQEQYGDAWLRTGILLHVLSPDLERVLRLRPEIALAWIMILNKLIRASFKPHVADHWRDIAGYATLVLNKTNEEEENELPDK